MSFEEMAAWLANELAEERLSQEQVADLLAQRMLFDRNRAVIEQEFRQKVVGYVANDRLIADSTRAILEAAAAFHGRMLYFEPIGRRAF